MSKIAEVRKITCENNHFYIIKKASKGANWVPICGVICMQVTEYFFFQMYFRKHNLVDDKCIFFSSYWCKIMSSVVAA